MINILIILLLIFIIGIIFFNNMNSYHSKNLVFTSAGDNTNFHKIWLNHNRNYDVYCVYYGENMDNYNLYSNNVDRIWKRKGSKFQNFHYIYTNYYDEIQNYERVFILDDDIVMSTADINNMFDYANTYDLWICQPSFSDDSKISYDITKNKEGNILHYTNFIEVNTPLFSKHILDKFMTHYDPILIGWGIDFLYMWSSGIEEKKRYAIIDKIICINPHDDMKPSKKRELNNIVDVDRRQEFWEIIKKKKNIPDYDIMVYNIIKENCKNLVFTSAGDNTNFYDYWLDENRNYDVYCIYYGDNNDNYLHYSSVVDKIWRRKGSKFQNFYYIYTMYYNIIKNYDRFFIMDDDIIISTDDINRMFNISENYDLWICQPSFTVESKISHSITQNNIDNILRYTNFIEVNTPLFSKYALEKFMIYYDPILVEWGVDYLYIWALGNITDKYAIIDTVLCTNPKDNDKKNKKREFYNISNSNNQVELWYIVKNRYNIPNINTMVFSTIKKDKMKLSPLLLEKDILNISLSQLKMLNMMKIFHNICKINNINYFLIAGSLLGCIRHNGWIPWDGDIDLMVDTNDIKKLKEKCMESDILMKNNMWFQDSTTDKNYKLPWSKIRDNNSCYIGDIDNSHHNGLMIDIFEYKKINNNDIILLNYDKKEEIFNMKDIFPLKKHVFEDTMFYIPNNYKKFIKYDYGDNWNTILEVEKRIPHEGNGYLEPYEACEFHKKLYK